jgi:hypothetical protein
MWKSISRANWTWNRNADLNGGSLALCRIESHSPITPEAERVMPTAIFCFYVKFKFPDKLSLKPKAWCPRRSFVFVWNSNSVTNCTWSGKPAVPGRSFVCLWNSNWPTN